jgi:sec-independent protein translocase protein TatB
MGNVGWSELLVIGIVALIVVGPKDLPVMFHTLGRFAAKVRSLGREFTRAMDDAARESGVKDVANTVRDVTSPKALGLDKMQEAARKFESWDPMKPKDTKPPSPRGPATTALAEDQDARRKKLAEEAAAKAAARQAEVEVPAAPPEPGAGEEKPL